MNFIKTTCHLLQEINMRIESLFFENESNESKLKCVCFFKKLSQNSVNFVILYFVLRGGEREI